MISRSRIPFLIVICQFFGTSVWFAGNIVIPELRVAIGAEASSIANALAAVQFGFITGTLVFAVLSFADRFSPSRVFMISALLGALANLAMIFPNISLNTILISRFATGFFLAGIYPVGMKIASDYYEKGLGKALGFLVGALVLGTALPHALDSMGVSFNYRSVTWMTSILAILGGLLIGFGVPDGPYRSKQQKLELAAIPRLFAERGFRKAAYGYWGHMWELYAFWAFVPLFLEYYAMQQSLSLNTPLWSFLIIGIGGISCAAGGVLSLRYGSRLIARAALILSGISCILSVFAVLVPQVIFLSFMLIWGAAVVADSPQFSTMVAANAVPRHRATALTLVNCIGFAITIFSIQLLAHWAVATDLRYLFVILAAGPIFGVLSQVRSSL